MTPRGRNRTFAPVDVDSSRARSSGGPAHAWAGALESALDRVDLTFQSGRVHGLARPLLDDAMTLAGKLARSRLGGGDQPVLDLVALSERTCGLPAARESAQRCSTASCWTERRPRRVVHWDSAAIRVESDLAKQAASIGACWASS